MSVHEHDGFESSKQQLKGSSCVFDLGGFIKKKSCIQQRVEPECKAFGPMRGRKVTDPGVVQQLESLKQFYGDKSVPLSKYFGIIHLFFSLQILLAGQVPNCKLRV